MREKKQMGLDAETQRKIAEDRASGMSVKEVAEKYGVGKSSVAKYSKLAVVEIPTIEVDLSERAEALEPPKPVERKAMPRAVEAFMKKVETEVKAPVAVEPKDNRAEIVQRILLNAESFPDVFGTPATERELAGKSVSELSALLTSMEHTRAVKALGAQMKQVFLVACRGTEVVGKAVLKLKTDGLTDALMKQQAELDFLFRELAIKHAGKLSATTSPEMRLLTLFGMTMLQTDATNRLRERVVSADTQQKYEDI